MQLTIQPNNNTQSIDQSGHVLASYKKIGLNTMLRMTCVSLLFFCVGLLGASDHTVSKSSGEYDVGTSEKDTCDNIIPPKYKCGEYCTVENGQEVWKFYCIKIGSVIDLTSFNHIHYANDYLIGSPSVGCSPCGAGASNAAGLESVHLQRVHRFRDMTEHSSFSPGVFQKYDISLRFAYKESIKERQIFLFDPNTMARYAFLDTNNDGVYTDPTHNSHKNITLYTGLDGTGATVSDFTQAQSAVLTTHKGHTWSFSLHNLAASAPAPWLDQDLGKPNYQGYVQWYDATSGIIAGGGQLSDGVKDEGRALYQAMNGDASLSVAVNSFTTAQGLADESTKASAQAAATIRAGLDTGSIMASVGIRKDGQVVLPAAM